MKAYGKPRVHSCCPGHDKYPFKHGERQRDTNAWAKSMKVRERRAAKQDIDERMDFGAAKRKDEENG